MILDISCQFWFHFPFFCLHLHWFFKIIHRFWSIVILELVVLEQLTQIQMIKLGAVQHSCQSEVLKIIGIVVLGVHSVICVGDCLVCEVLVLIVLLGVCAGAFLVVVSISLPVDAVYSHPDDGWASDEHLGIWRLRLVQLLVRHHLSNRALRPLHAQLSLALEVFILGSYHEVVNLLLELCLLQVNLILYQVWIGIVHLLICILDVFQILELFCLSELGSCSWRAADATRALFVLQKLSLPILWWWWRRLLEMPLVLLHLRLFRILLAHLDIQLLIFWVSIIIDIQTELLVKSRLMVCCSQLFIRPLIICVKWYLEQILMHHDFCLRGLIRVIMVLRVAVSF